METPKYTLKKKVFYLILILLVASLLSFIVLEVFARIFLNNIVPTLVPDSEVGQIYRLNFHSIRYIPESERDIHIDTNSFGYRDDEWDNATTANRIMVIGDSFVDASQVETGERFTEILENKFRNMGEPIEIYNFGKSGSGPETYYLVLKKWFKIIKPKAVIVSIFDGNDFENVNYDITPNSGRINYKIIDGDIHRYSELASSGTKLKWNIKTFIGKSYVFAIFNDFLTKLNANSNQGPATATNSIPFYCDINNKDRENSYKIVDKLITDMHEIASSTLIILQIPVKDQYILVSEKCDNSLPEKSVAEIADRLSIPKIQMLNIMGSTTNEYYYPGHLNPLGHELVAKSLFDLIESKLNNSSLEYK